MSRPSSNGNPVAKVTINPALTQGVGHVIGSIAPGKLADLVLWEPAFVGAKPKMVIKGGMINRANMGDPDASLPTPQPTFYRPMFGALGAALSATCETFVSQAAHDRGAPGGAACGLGHVAGWLLVGLAYAAWGLVRAARHRVDGHALAGLAVAACGGLVLAGL